MVINLGSACVQSNRFSREYRRSASSTNVSVVDRQQFMLFIPKSHRIGIQRIKTLKNHLH